MLITGLLHKGLSVSERSCRSKKSKRPKVDAYLHQVTDKKLKGSLRQRERVYDHANKTVLKVSG